MFSNTLCNNSYISYIKTFWTGWHGPKSISKQLHNLTAAAAAIFSDITDEVFMYAVCWLRWPTNQTGEALLLSAASTNELWTWRPCLHHPCDDCCSCSRNIWQFWDCIWTTGSLYTWHRPWKRAYIIWSYMINQYNLICMGSFITSKVQKGNNASYRIRTTVIWFVCVVLFWYFTDIIMRILYAKYFINYLYLVQFSVTVLKMSMIKMFNPKNTLTGNKHQSKISDKL